jgi:hypothetical protein
MRRHNSVPRRLSQILSTPPQSHAALMSAFKPILLVTMPRVAETFKSVMHEMTYRTNFELIHSLQEKNVNHSRNLNRSIDKPEHRWNIHYVAYDALISRVKPSSNGQLSYWLWSVGMFDEPHRYKMKNSVSW